MPTGDLLSLRTQLGQRRGYDGTITRLDAWLNQAAMLIWGHRPDWAFARREVQLLTRAPDEYTAGSATNGVHTISTGLTFTKVRMGAMISTPDGAVYRVVGSTSDGDVLIPVPYPGADATLTLAGKVYYDTLALPADCSEVESVMASGASWEIPVPQRSVLPQSMARLARAEYESWPTHFSHDRSGAIPAPNAPPAAASSGAGNVDGAVKYWYAFYNDVTGEIGPLSPVLDFTASTDTVSLTSLQVHQDYKRVIFRSKAGGKEPLMCGRLESRTLTSFSDNIADTGLGMDDGLLTGIYYGANRSGSQYKLRLWPPPDDAYTVTVAYFADYMEMYEEHHVTGLQNRFIPHLLDLAESLALREEERHGDARALRRDAMMEVDKISAEQDVDPTTEGGVGHGEDAPETEGRMYGRWPRFVDQ